MTEFRVLFRCRIDNILPLYAISLDGPEPCLVYQFMPNGSLEDRLLCKKNTPPLTWTQRANIAEGVAQALNFLHTSKDTLVHGDVKSANILLDLMFQPKLGDFGLAKQVMHNESKKNSIYTHCKVTSVHGTSVYLPNEYLRHKILSPAVDVYSYGIVILEMATGRRAYDGKKLLVNSVEDEYTQMRQNSLQFSVTHNAQQSQNETMAMTDMLQNTLLDKRIANLTDDRYWFSCLLELGRKCAHRTKSKRPKMIQVLEYFNQCKTTTRIQRMCVDKASARRPCLSKDNIKNPLELQLWYDYVRESCGTLSEAVFDNFGAQVTKLIEDIKLSCSNDDNSTYHLDVLLNSLHNYQSRVGGSSPIQHVPTQVVSSDVNASSTKTPNCQTLSNKVSNLTNDVDKLSINTPLERDSNNQHLPSQLTVNSSSNLTETSPDQTTFPGGQDYVHSGLVEYSSPFIPLLTALGFDLNEESEEPASK